MNNCSPYGNYRTRTFCDIFPSFNDFKTAYQGVSVFANLQLTTLETFYYLLYGKYGNAHIAGSDETQWKYRLFSLSFMYGPAWEKELAIQNIIRQLTENDIRDGNINIVNHAFNPSTTIEDGPNQPYGEITTTNEQNKNKTTYSKLAGYSNLLMLLKKDVTNEFLNLFNKLFLTIVQPQYPLWYISEE